MFTLRKSKTTLIEMILHCILNNQDDLPERNTQKNRKGTVLGFFLGLRQSRAPAWVEEICPTTKRLPSTFANWVEAAFLVD